MTDQELKKSIEQIVEEILAKPAPEATATETVAKAAGELAKEGELSSGSPEGISANGGKNQLLGASSEKDEAAKKEDEAKKAQADAEEKEKKEKEEKEKAEKMKKAQEDEKKEKDEKDAEEAKKAKKMKKSLAELSEHLDAEEVELIKAWREETSEESMQKSEAVEQEDLVKTIAKAVEDQIGNFKKVLDEKDLLIKSLSEKVEKISSQPAYDRRSIATLETLEKSGTESKDISKTQVLDKLLDLQRQEKGVTSHHIAEFEATNNISDSVIKSLVFKELGIK